MLQTKTVEKQTFKLLKQLMQDPFLSDFLLAGGTNLALQLGHRKSVDLDMFSWKKIEKRIIEMIKFENKIFDNYPI